MSDMYEVAFSGQIAEGAELDTVKSNIAKMFKADDTKLAQLFSGKRIVIKKNIDQQTAAKYEAAMKKAGAVCEVLNLSQPVEEVVAAPPPAETEPAAPVAQTVAASTQDYSDRNIPPAPQTVPLDISGEQIADLSASVAPVGSELQDLVEENIAPPPVPEGMSMAPVGSELSEHEEEVTPPLPDTSGLSIIEN